MRLTKLFGLVFISAILGLGFTSCSDDDKVGGKHDKYFGTWKLAEINPEVVFTAEFIKEQGAEVIKAKTIEVEAEITKITKNKYRVNDAKFILAKDSKYTFSFTEEGEAKTVDGTYSIAKDETKIDFRESTAGAANQVCDLTPTTISYMEPVHANDIIMDLATFAVEGIPTDAIKSASTTVVFRLMNK